MPILNNDTKDFLKDIYAQNIHNLTARVKKITGTTTNNSNPHYETDVTNVLTIYIGFRYSKYKMLSGKTNRLFELRDIPKIISELGKTEDEVIVIQYVSDVLLDPEDPVDPQIINNLKVDEEIEIGGEWWKVRKIISDSENIQQTGFITK